MAQLRSHYQEIKEAGGEILLVSFYPLDRTRNWARRLDFPFKLACDTTRDVYRRYGLGLIKSHEASTAASVMEGIKGFMKLGKVPEHLMHVSQLGGYFVVDPTGIVLYTYTPRNAIDNPPFDELLDALKKE